MNARSKAHELKLPEAIDAESGLVNVIVEAPRGSPHKFKFDPELGLFKLDKILPAGAVFPYDFGFVPGTLGEDGDPVDLMIVGTEPTFTGCLVEVRLLGVIEAEQTEKGETVRNDRLIGAPVTKNHKPTWRSLGDVPARVLDEIEHFFVSYNRAENREFVPLARRGPKIAMRAIEQAVGSRRDPGSRPPAARSDFNGGKARHHDSRAARASHEGSSRKGR